MATHHPSAVNAMVSTDPGTNEFELFMSKIDALMAVALSGQSFAVRIPFSNFAAPYLTDPEALRLARADMKVDELFQYKTWSNGTNTLPTIDWSISRVDVEPCETKLMSMRAVAMQRIWSNDFLSTEHACWVWRRVDNDLRDLIIAVVKINTAQCNLIARRKGRSAEDLDLASVQGIMKIVSVAHEDFERYLANLNTLDDRVHRASAILQNRKDTLEAKTMDTRHWQKKEQINN